MRRSRYYKNEHFLPLQLACESGVSKLTVTALDTLAKLCAHGYFTDVTLPGQNSSSSETPAGESETGDTTAATAAVSYPQTFADVLVDVVSRCELETEQVSNML